VTARQAIIVADDLGYDPSIDEGILEAHRDGVVTATSALVTGPFSEAALRAAPRSLAVGLHLDLPSDLDGPEAEQEIRRQFRRFEAIRGAMPVHVDGHRHVHAEPRVLEALLRVAAPLRLRVRALDAPMRDRIRAAGARACDAFLGDADLRPCWTPEHLAAAAGALAAGSTEIMLHPGHLPTHVRTGFAAEREIELAAALDPRVREAFRSAGVSLAGRLPG
jgi:predicted glycoside hydrolase/deacetylase ChbG (UPF0249 family)